MKTQHIHRFSARLYNFFNLTDASQQVERTGVQIIITEVEPIVVGNSKQQAFFTVLGTEDQVARLRTVVAYLSGEGVACYELGSPKQADFLG